MHRFLSFLGLLAAPSLLGAETVEHEGALYHVHRVPVARLDKLQLRWLDDSGAPLIWFNGLQRQLEKEGHRFVFATNAGIYERGPKPCGLTVVQSKELLPLNLSEGEGNFFLKPNGVFYVDDQKGPGIVDAREWMNLGLQPRLANQSGPLLLQEGVIHPAFNVNSPNLRQRSAVGIVKATREVIFVMSDRKDRSKGRVTFHQLSRFFLHLGCADALFLDGDISEMITAPLAPEMLTRKAPNTFAGMFVELR